MNNFLSHLECTETGEIFSADEPHSLSPNAQKVLYPRYDLDAAKQSLDPNSFIQRPRNMWRFFELMPIRNEDNIVSLGEGGTPMLRAKKLEAQHGVKTLFIKDEGINPTGSFKARGLSAAVSKAKELGLKRLTVPSAGNAAGSLASYCARADIECFVFMPKDAPDANQKETILAGGY